MSQVVDCINNLDALPDMDAGCVDAIVTDPPYGLAFMGKAWDKTLPDPRTWSECLRVLKPGGHAVIFGAPRLYHRLACAVEDAGFEVRDVLMWMFGSGFPKSLDVSKAIDGHLGVERERVPATGGLHKNANLNDDGWKNIGLEGATMAGPVAATPEAAAWAGWGTALKPAYEPILLVRKPLVGTVAQNVLTHGTGGINVDACRVEAVPGDEPLRWEHGRSMGFHGAEDRGPCAALTSPGRWPANVIMDEGPEEWRRYFYCPKASRSEREVGLKAPDGQRANTHPTVKPIALMEWLVRLVTPPGGLVLDPFCGSGSTGVACARLGVRFLGLEMDPDYAALARMRVEHARRPL